MNEKLLSLLEGNAEYYPHILEERFQRVFNKILELCETDYLEAYLLDLMVDRRGGTRQGFPAEAATEIIRLDNYLRTLRVKGENTSVWKDVPELKRLEVERLGYGFSPEDFLKSIEDNSDAVHVFLSCGVDLEVKDERNWTPLMFAVSNRNEKLALLFIHCGASVAARDTNGFTPLHGAALNGMSSVVEALISKGADVNSKSKFGWTPLMQACTYGHLQACAILIASGADINASSSDGTTALHKAASKGYGEIVQLLLSKRANREIKNHDGNTPLALAAKLGRGQIVDLLNTDDAPVKTENKAQDGKLKLI